MGAFRWQSAVDFFVLAGGIYLLLRWSRQARALRLAVGILALRVGSLISGQLGLVMTRWVLDAVTIVVLLALVIVFQPELRRALMHLDFPGRARRLPRVPIASAISAAAWALARQRCGALIVLAQRDPISELITPGVQVDARLSADILEAIFQKSSPTHDGAAVIQGDTLAQVGAILPLTQRVQVPGAYGTRHRAGMGLTERCDALVVVVSEERGEVTLMSGAGTQAVHSDEELVAALNALATTPRENAAGARRFFRWSNVGLAATALLVSASVWSLTFLLPGASVRIRSVPLEFTNIPPGLVITSQSADAVEVSVRGNDFVLDSVSLQPQVARCDLAGAHEGSNTLTVGPGAFDLPVGLRLEAVTPRRVTVHLSASASAPVQ